MKENKIKFIIKIDRLINLISSFWVFPLADKEDKRQCPFQYISVPSFRRSRDSKVSKWERDFFFPEVPAQSLCWALLMAHIDVESPGFGHWRGVSGRLWHFRIKYYFTLLAFGFMSRTLHFDFEVHSRNNLNRNYDDNNDEYMLII